MIRVKGDIQLLVFAVIFSVGNILSGLDYIFEFDVMQNTRIKYYNVHIL